MAQAQTTLQMSQTLLASAKDGQVSVCFPRVQSKTPQVSDCPQSPSSHMLGSLMLDQSHFLTV